MTPVYFGQDILNSFLNEISPINNYKYHEKNFSTAYDISKDEEKYVYTTTASGLVKEDLVIDVHNNHLIVKTKNKSEDKFVSSFNHKIKLGHFVDTNNVTASLDKGILKVNIPLRSEDQKSTNVKFI